MIAKAGNPAVSVILPVFNVEPYIRECLDSVTGQTLKDIEIICVNDGSTDASPEIIREDAAKDSRIRIIDQENSGASVARNSGVDAAAGKYIYFMDSDDILEPEALELCFENMERRNLEMVCFNAVSFAEDETNAEIAERENRKYFTRELNEDRVYSGRELFAELKENDFFIVPTWACMISKAALVENGISFHPGIIHEDEPWTFAVMMSVSRCGCINRNLYRRRVRDGSLMTSGNTFLNPYCMFVSLMDMQQMFTDRPELQEAEKFKDVEVGHLKKMQKRAIRRYRMCSKEEKQKRRSLGMDERVLFELIVAYPASQKNKIKKLEKENLSLEEENRELKEELQQFKKDAK